MFSIPNLGIPLPYLIDGMYLMHRSLPPPYTEEQLKQLNAWIKEINMKKFEVPHVGEYIEEALEATGLTPVEILDKTELPARVLRGLIERRDSLTPYEAEAIGKVIGRPAHVLLNMDKAHWDWRLGLSKSFVVVSDNNTIWSIYEVERVRNHRIKFVRHAWGDSEADRIGQEMDVSTYSLHPTFEQAAEIVREEMLMYLKGSKDEFVEVVSRARALGKGIKKTVGFLLADIEDKG
jgi:plasmid maintenance system antidote protein VapI